MGQPRARSPSCEPVSPRVKGGAPPTTSASGGSRHAAPRTTPSEFPAPSSLGGETQPHGPVAGTMRPEAEVRVRLPAAFLGVFENRNPYATLLLRMASQGETVHIRSPTWGRHLNLLKH